MIKQVQLAQHQNNINQAIDQVMKGEKVNISEATGGQLKTLDDVKKHIKANQKQQSTHEQPSSKTIINSSNNTSNIKMKSEVNPDKTVLVRDSYQLAQQAGFSPAQAKALIGELGRENGFNIETMFGFHKDASNHKQNGGIFSWQGSRAIALESHMRAKGLINKDGTFKRTNESLQAQFEFLRKEIVANPKWKASFLDKKNITNDEARAALGGKGTIIGWARGQDRSVALTGEIAITDDKGQIVGGQAYQLADIVEEFKLPSIIVETNGIGGHVPSILRSVFKKRNIYCGVRELHETQNKNKRILGTLEAPLLSGYLYAHQSVLQVNGTESPQVKEMRLFDPSVTNNKDDYVDSLAGAISAEAIRIGTHNHYPTYNSNNNWQASNQYTEMKLDF